MKSSLWLLVLGLVVAVQLVAFGGGMILLVTLFGSVVTLLLAPVLWFRGKPRRAAEIVAAWGVYVVLYISVSTGLALFNQRKENPIAIGQEFCADAGCFGVDDVARTAADSETIYTLLWHLSSRDKEKPRRFPGKGLELYVFDEQGRKFGLPAADNHDPLDVTLPPGGTVRQSISFNVAADAKELFLTARYRPLTFQSLLPGELSVVPRSDAKMIRIR